MTPSEPIPSTIQTPEGCVSSTKQSSFESKGRGQVDSAKTWCIAKNEAVYKLHAITLVIYNSHPVGCLQTGVFLLKLKSSLWKSYRRWESLNFNSLPAKQIVSPLHGALIATCEGLQDRKNTIHPMNGGRIILPKSMPISFQACISFWGVSRHLALQQGRS